MSDETMRAASGVRIRAVSPGLATPGWAQGRNTREFDPEDKRGKQTHKITSMGGDANLRQKAPGRSAAAATAWVLRHGVESVARLYRVGLPEAMSMIARAVPMGTDPLARACRGG